MTTSRIPGFHVRSLRERRAVIASRLELPSEALNDALREGGLQCAMADQMVENVLGTYALPFGVVLNVTVNGRDRLAPVVVEEPSVIAAASNAAKMIRAAGGFQAQLDEQLMTAQVQLFDVPDGAAAKARLEGAREELLAIATASVPDLVRVGGGPRDIEVRDLGEGFVVVHVSLDCVDAMGANTANTVAEAVGPRAAELGQGKLGLRILSNLCERRTVHVHCRVHEDDLATSRRAALAAPSGLEVADAIEQASRFAERDPYRAATHNKGIMNGVDAVVVATGNDWRAVEAGAHAFAALSGRYQPLAVWRRSGEYLEGRLQMPLALGIVGGTLRAHPTARLAIQIAGIERAGDLIMLAAAVGLASNLAALRALATEGIQRGHMDLHARSVAAAAGASSHELPLVARAILDAKSVTPEAATAAIYDLRSKGLSCAQQ